MTATDAIPIILSDAERGTLRVEIAEHRLKGLAETVEYVEERGEDIEAAVGRLRAAVMLLDLALGYRDDLPLAEVRPLECVLVEWRNEAHICASYEDGEQREFIEQDQAAAAVFDHVYRQVWAAHEADAERELASQGVMA